MTHLTSDELIDAVEGTLDAVETTLDEARQQHLDTCEVCRSQVADLASVLGEALAVAVPEPSPLFWEHLSQRVRTAIAAEPPASGGWGSWLRWPVLAPMAALALIVLALAVALPREARIVPEVATSEASDTTIDDRFDLVADLVGDFDWETAVSAGLTVAPGAADRAVLELTALEQQALTRLLQAELTRAKS